MTICEICKREFKSKKGLGYHLSIAHQMTYREYFDIYLKTETDGICLVCGKETPFARNGYKECCSSKCTCLHRYGVEHNSQIPEVKARMHTPEAHQKVKETNLKKYGVKSQFQRAEVREKANIASHSEEAKAKIRKTCLEKYGVDSPLKIEEIHSKGVEASKTKETKDKIKQTCLDRYGVSCGLQTSIAKERAQSEGAKLKRVKSIKKTNLNRYDVEWPAQNKESFEKQKQTNLERYGSEYLIQTEKSIQTKIKNKQNTISKYENNNFISRQHLIEKYGQGWLSLNRPNIKENNITFLESKYESTIQDYYNRETGPCSKQQQELKDFLKSFYNRVLRFNFRRAIYPYELDIYIPDLNLAIEYNGLYWHSTMHKEPDYHLKKSLLCREKGIRLIHIYEFEDLTEQTQLLKNLILGIDDYPKDDFNKNNLIDNIPEPEVIYNEHYIIYGAGKIK